MKISTTTSIHTLPADGYVRLAQIIGDPRRGIPGPIPVGATTWWEWVRTGRAPQPIKLGPGLTVWRASDIRDLIERLASEAQATPPPARGESLTAARRRRTQSVT